MAEGIAGGDSAVVGGEDDDGVVGKFEIIEGFSRTIPTASSIDLHHSRVDRAVLHLSHRKGAIDEEAVSPLWGFLAAFLLVLGPEFLEWSE